MVIHHVPRIIKWFYPQYFWNGNRSEKVVYLTFDDGPVPKVTDFVLEELRRRKMKATFFMVGDNIVKNPSLAKEVLAQGHGIGNHTHNHLKGTAVRDDVYWENWKKCQDIIQDISGQDCKLFRPPYGRIKKSQRKVIGLKQQIIMWDVLSGDYAGGQTAEKCLRKTIQHTRNGSVVVFHDQQKTEKVIREVLPDYLDHLQQRGYQTKVL